MNRKPFHGAIVAAALAVTLSTAGCGGSTPHSSINRQTMRDARASDASENQMRAQFIEDAAGVPASMDTMDYRAGRNRCSVDVWLTSPAYVKMYAGPNSGVVTNAAQTFGVKMTAYQGSSDAACASEAQRVLASVR